MRKKLLLFLLLIAASVQGQIIFQEDFNGIPGPTAGGAGTYTFPSGWLLRNVDNRTPAAQVAYVNEAWERREDFLTNVADSCAFSTSWYQPAGASDDWMWTPAIEIPTTGLVKLSWRGIAYDPLYRDGYEVRVMGNGETPTGGSGVIGNQVTNSTVLYATAAEQSSWTPHEIDVTAYAGQTVRFAFRNNSTDKFLLCIDDVTVRVLIPYAAELVDAIRPSEYTRVPLNQRKPLGFSAKIKTTGSEALTAYLRVQALDSEDNVVYTSISEPVTLDNAGDVSAVLSVAEQFLPEAAGTYTFKYAVINSVDDEQLGDEVMYSMIYTDTEMARDSGIASGSLGIGAGNGGYLGQSYAIEAAATLKTVDIYHIGNTGVDAEPIEMGCAIFKLVNGTPELLHTVEPQIIEVDTEASAMQYVINPPLQLEAGDVIVVCAQEFGQTLPVALANDIFVPGTTYVDWPTSPLPDWGHNEDFGASFAKSYMIRPHLSCILEAPIVETQQLLCGDLTVGDLEAIGDNIKWYANIDDETPLETTTPLESGNYYVSQTVDICESDRVLVTLTVNEISSATTTISVCDSFTWDVNGTTYTDGGTYTFIDGCHTETLELTLVDSVSITEQPQDLTIDEGTAAMFSVTTSGLAEYQWQVSSDNGQNWTDILEGDGFTGAQTGTLTIDASIVSVAMSGYQFRVVVMNGVCDDIISDAATFSVTLGIGSFNQDMIKIYPNPAASTVQVEIADAVKADLSVLDINGRLIKSLSLENPVNAVNTADLASGVYFFRIATDKGEAVKKVIKQ